jgi:hypothetical protein
MRQLVRDSARKYLVEPSSEGKSFIVFIFLDLDFSHKYFTLSEDVNPVALVFLVDVP